MNTGIDAKCEFRLFVRVCFYLCAAVARRLKGLFLLFIITSVYGWVSVFIPRDRDTTVQRARVTVCTHFRTSNRSCIWLSDAGQVLLRTMPEDIRDLDGNIFQA